jgi:hypothetical protein
MAYATVAQLRAYLKLPTVAGTPNATPQQVSDTDALLTDILDRATDAIDQILEFSFGVYPDASAKKIMSLPARTLALPPHDPATAPTVAWNGQSITDFTHIVERKRGYLLREAGWPRGPLDVTAKWGYGPAPKAIEEVALELAVNIWRAKDRGLFSDAIGVDGVGTNVGGGSVAYSGALTSHQRMVINSIKRSYEVTAV